MAERKDMDTTCTVLLYGVGGQGTILAADLLARSAMLAGYDLKLSEIHGMAQRGGAVVTVVRFGTKVSSMVGDLGTADFILSFETTEALRALPYLCKGGTLFVNDETIKPLPVLRGAAGMPPNPTEDLKAAGAYIIPALEIARLAGNPKTLNVALLGALASKLPIDTQVWESQIKERVPQRTIDSNISAFRAGYQYLKEESV